MTNAFERGLILFQQGRYDLAEREFRRSLGESPDFAMSHALLALCLSHVDRDEDALREADEAIRIEPDRAYCHYVRGQVLCGLGRLKEAEASLREAIALDPDDARSFGVLAHVHMSSRRWNDALETAEQGLAIDPENSLCTNVRAMALTQLGRKEEASLALGSALADDPENAFTHANQGWTLLHQGDHVKALEHFREALRIDPEFEWAQAGIVEALKARHLVYRLMLRFFLWIGRQSHAAQWILILGFVFGRRILASIAASHPQLAPFITPILYLSFGFLILTWIASPLFNFFLRFNRFGRLALSAEQTTSSTWIGSCFLIAAGLFAGSLVHPTPFMNISTSYFGLLLFPLATTFERVSVEHRRKMAAFTAVLALLGLPILSLALLGEASPWRDVGRAIEFFQYFIYGCILSTWLSGFLSMRST